MVPTFPPARPWLAAFRSLPAVLVAAILFTATVQAGTFEDAVAAYDRGDYATALRLYLPLAKAGMPVAQYNVGLMYDKGLGARQDDAEARRWFGLAADRGLAAAQYGRGYMHFKGAGVPQDYAKALWWFRRAADQGDADAQSGLGSLYSTGRGVPQSPVLGLKWFNLAISGLDGTMRERAISDRDRELRNLTSQQVPEATTFVQD